MPGIALDCHIDYVGTSFRVTDVFCLLLCLFISFCVLFIYGLTITGRISSKDLSDETSVSYQVFFTLLSRRKTDYFKERDQAERRARLREVMRLQQDADERRQLFGSEYFDEMLYAADVSDMDNR